MSAWNPSLFNMPEPPKESIPPSAMHSMPTPPSPANENAAMQLLLKAALNFSQDPILSEVQALKKAFEEEKDFFNKNNLSIYSNPAIRYTTVAKYLTQKTNPKKAGKKTYKRNSKYRKTRKHRTM